MARQDEPGSYTGADHEPVDLVLCFDSGYWVFLAGHTPAAIAAGIWVETIEALRDGQEALTENLQMQIESIRAARDNIADELWSRMLAHIKTERGVVELLYQVCLLVFHHTFTKAVRVREMTDFFDRMLAEYKAGTREQPMNYRERRQKLDEQRAAAR